MMLGNYTVPNKELKISVGMTFDSAKLDGQTSGTDSSHKGIKAKTISVQLLIAFTEPNALTQLTAVAEAVTANGDKKIYDIVEDTANAMKVRQVQFAERFEARMDYRWNAWQVSFNLVEYKSVAEKTEQRQQKATAPAQSATGNEVADGEGDQEADAPVTGVESFIAGLDRMLS